MITRVPIYLTYTPDNYPPLLLSLSAVINLATSEDHQLSNQSLRTNLATQLIEPN
jgi:hypothetical protein